MDLSKLSHGLFKLLLGFVKVCLCVFLALCQTKPSWSLAKISKGVEASAKKKVLIESKMLWVRCFFGNILSEYFLASSKNHFLVRCLETKKYGGEEQVKRRGSRGSSWFPRWGVRHCDTGGHGQLPSRSSASAIYNCATQAQYNTHYTQKHRFITQKTTASFRRQLTVLLDYCKLNTHVQSTT